MKTISLKKHSSLSQKNIFQISTDVENFHKIMPNYFISLKILEQIDNKIIVFEKIKFMGMHLSIKTRHLILEPNIHEIHILSGPTKGSKFIEKYIASNEGTDIFIEVKLVFNGLFKIFRFLEGYVAKQMDLVMDEFILSSEKFYSTNIRFP